jgi:putative peptidoglycan lipid II flippase
VSVGERRSSGGAALVAAGILLSRLFGLVRGRLLAHYLGVSAVNDALQAAIRIPNILQNLFGEGVLSASFIPVYARLLAQGDEEEAGKVAGAIGALLALTSTVLVLVGIVAAPYVIPLIAGGFTGEKRDLTVLLVQIMFPGVGLLVMSAWALGVLNAHRKFFLSYASPVAMNVVMITVLVWRGPELAESIVGAVQLVTLVAWASVVGSMAQVAVQLPTLLRVERRLRVSLAVGNRNVRAILSNFLPVFIGRGVVQISAYADGLIASFVSNGAVTLLANAQVIAVLPVSLFGMAVSASQLPAMSGELGDDATVSAALRTRLDDGLRRIAFYVVPSSVAFFALGDIVGGVLYQSGRFQAHDTLWLWSVLAGSSVGLLAGTLGRLYASTWYALRNTKVPLKFALVRVALTVGLGLVASLYLPRWIGVDARWGAAGLTASAGLAAWVEFALLRRSIAERIGALPVESAYIRSLWGSALVAALAALTVKVALQRWHAQEVQLLSAGSHPLLLGAIALPLYGLTYLVLTRRNGIPEATAVSGRIARLLRAS